MKQKQEDAWGIVIEAFVVGFILFLGMYLIYCEVVRPTLKPVEPPVVEEKHSTKFGPGTPETPYVDPSVNWRDCDGACID